MTLTGKVAITLLGAGGALGVTAVVESPTARRAVVDLINRSGLREALQGAAEKVAVQLVQAAFGDRPPIIAV